MSIENRLEKLERKRGVGTGDGGSCKCSHEVRFEGKDLNADQPRFIEGAPPTICPKCNRPKDMIVICFVDSAIPDPRAVTFNIKTNQE